MRNPPGPSVSDSGAAHSGPHDRSAEIEALCRRWAGIVDATAARYGLDGFDRDDLMQRVRVRVWRALERRPEALLEPGYGHAAATSAAIDIVRAQRGRRAASHLPLEAAESHLGTSANPADPAELLAALDSALGRLDQARRVAVRFHLSGTHARDIARMTGWTEARTRNLLYRGLADLKAVLEGALG